MLILQQLSFLNIGNGPEDIIVEQKDLENDLPAQELEENEDSPEIAPKQFHEKNGADGNEGSKHLTRTGTKNTKTHHNGPFSLKFVHYIFLRSNHDISSNNEKKITVFF